MLFVESKTSDLRVDRAKRLLLLNRLQDKGLAALIRSTRLSCFEAALLAPDRDFAEAGSEEMERIIAGWTEAEEKTPYVRGEVFCQEDFVLFVVFGDTEDRTGLRAGIIYEAETTEPLKKLDAFCHNIIEAHEAVRDKDDADVKGSARDAAAEWQLREPHMPAGFVRFVAVQDVDSLNIAARKGTAIDRQRASEMLEDADVREVLRRTREAHVQGHALGLLTTGENGADDISISQLSDAGLLRRELLVSCRKKGHALFRLPSPDALAVVTASSAVCSECGVAVADEKVEEVIAPTELASALLEDGSWLVNRVRAVLRGAGVRESEIAVGPAHSDGETHMMVNVCGEPFLLILRDGELATGHARRALDAMIETRVPHLAVIATGSIRDEARVRLEDYARRRERGGDDIEVMLVEGIGAAAPELERAFERVSQRVIAEQLCELDASLGLNISHLIAARFQVLRRPGTAQGRANDPAARALVHHSWRDF